MFYVISDKMCVHSSVRVWSYAKGTTIKVLEGHTNFTRGLFWSPELPNIILSGSWDSTIRVWDISDGACLDIIEDHGADVYGNNTILLLNFYCQFF